MDCAGCREAFDRFVEGPLDEPEQRALAGHVAGCGDCRESMEWAFTIASDLESLGESIVADAPSIDVSAAVMAEVRRMKPVVPFKRRNRRPYWNWAAVAAAAGLIFAISLWTISAPAPPDVIRVSRGETPGIANPSPAGETSVPGELTEDSEAETTDVPPGPRIGSPPNAVASTGLPKPSAYTRENILAAMRESFDLSQGRQRLAELARLSSEDAAELLADRRTAPSAVMGASLGIDGPEVSKALYDVVGHRPEDPFARYRLARSYALNPDTQTLADDQIDAMQALDPENAMAYYLRAQQFLSTTPPDLKAALEALESARSLDAAGFYADDAARALAQAHIAAGVAPDVANLLGALTAGRWSYDEANGIAGDLMALGQEYQDAGELQTAATIFESVLSMGQQVDSGAMYAQERLAGLDIQRDAVQALEPLYQLLSEPERIQDLVNITTALAGGLGEMEDYFAALGEFFNGDLPASVDGAFWSLFNDAVLNVGDINIIEIIRGLLGN